MTATVNDGVAHADYSQIELHAGDGGSVIDGGSSSAHVGIPVADAVGLVTCDDDYAIMTAARQHGSLRVRVEVHDSAPEVDPDWGCAVELSIRTGVGAAVTGWAGEGSVAIAVPPGADARVRYVVVGGQAGSEQDLDEPPAESYLFQLWPEAPAPPRLLIASDPWSHYWAWGPEVASAIAAVGELPEADRLGALVDIALERHPEIAAPLAAGDTRFRLGPIRYVQALIAGPERDHALVERVIDERARRSVSRA